MRTKTLILSGLLAALSGASALAQVYSLNAVGYINVNVPTGFSIIADQLYMTNQATSQSMDAVFGPTLLNGENGNTAPDPYVGCILFPYYNGGFGTPLIVEQTSAAPFWSSVPEATSTSFNPGQAAFIYNPGSAFTMTFVGQVPQGTVTNTMIQGFNLVASIIPQTGAVDTDLGIVPGANDIVFNYISGGYTTANIWEVIGASQFWGLGFSPTNTVGTGMFYYSASATPNNWIRTFNIN
jgi:hypothetical protein